MNLKECKKEESLVSKQFSLASNLEEMKLSMIKLKNNVKLIIV